MDAQALRLTLERPVLEAFPPTRRRQQVESGDLLDLSQLPGELLRGSAVATGRLVVSFD